MKTFLPEFSTKSKSLREIVGLKTEQTFKEKHKHTHARTHIVIEIRKIDKRRGLSNIWTHTYANSQNI